ncbi:MAG: hypothetical protein QXR87_02670 [Candidatus Hadarchaeales archaeon]
MMRMDALPTVCKKCRLFYLYPQGLDYSRNPCPRCGYENNHST